MLTLQNLSRAVVRPSLAVIAFAGVSVAQAQVGPITFTELEFPADLPVQGLTINTLDGASLPAPLSFDFPNTDATITGGPGTQMFVDPPGIEGPSDLPLNIDFGTPVDFAEFGFAVSCPPVVPNALTVNIFNSSGALIDTRSFDGQDTGFASAENLVTLQGMVFQSIEVTFPGCGLPVGEPSGWNGQTGDPTGGGGQSRFFVDNLTYDPAAGVPTMGLSALLVLAVVLVGASLWLLRRRQATV